MARNHTDELAKTTNAKIHVTADYVHHTYLIKCKDASFATTMDARLYEMCQNHSLLVTTEACGAYVFVKIHHANSDFVETQEMVEYRISDYLELCGMPREYNMEIIK